MPHDAAVYYPNEHLYVRTPEETKDRVEDEVEDARAQYERSADASYSDYRYLTAGTAQVPTPVITGFTPTSAPAIPAGTPVAVGILGSGFTATSTVIWDGTLTAATFVNAGRINVNPPSNIEKEGVPVVVVNGVLDSIPKNFPFTEPVVVVQTPNASWLKADIIDWLVEHGVNLSEPALSSLNKDELLSLAHDILSQE